MGGGINLIDQNYIARQQVLLQWGWVIKQKSATRARFTCLLISCVVVFFFFFFFFF